MNELKELEFTPKKAECYRCKRPATHFYAITGIYGEMIVVPACNVHNIRGMKKVLVELLLEDEKES